MIRPPGGDSWAARILRKNDVYDENFGMLGSKSSPWGCQDFIAWRILRRYAWGCCLGASRLGSTPWRGWMWRTHGNQPCCLWSRECLKRGTSPAPSHCWAGATGAPKAIRLRHHVKGGGPRQIAVRRLPVQIMSGWPLVIADLSGPGFRIRSDINRIRIQPLRTNQIRIRIQPLRTNRIQIWIQTPLSWKFYSILWWVLIRNCCLFHFLTVLSHKF